MKVLERSITPSGVRIQIEDWSQDYSYYDYGDVVATYPKAKHTAMNGYPENNETFRFELNCKDNTKAREVFDNLKNGVKKLKDYVDLASDRRYVEFVTGARRVQYEKGL